MKDSAFLFFYGFGRHPEIEIDALVEVVCDGNCLITAAQAKEIACRLLAYADRAPSDDEISAYNDRIARALNDDSRWRPTPRPLPPTFVYVMHDLQSGLHKIGRSKKPDVRERTLQAEKPSIVMLFAAPGSLKVELSLHERYAGKRVRGEWFRLDECDVAEIRKELRA